MIAHKRHLRHWKKGIVLLAIFATAIFPALALGCKPRPVASCTISTDGKSVSGNVTGTVTFDNMPAGSTAAVKAHLEGDATGASIDTARFEAGDFISGSQSDTLKPGESLTWNYALSDHATGFVRLVIDEYTVTSSTGKVVSKSHGAKAYPAPELKCFAPPHPDVIKPPPPVVPPVPVVPPPVVVPPVPVVPPAVTPSTPKKPAPPRIAIGKSVSPLRAGSLGWYRIDVTALDATKQVIVRDRLPDGLTLVDHIKGMTIFNGKLAWNLGPMLAGQHKSLYFRVRVDKNVQPHRLCNTARARPNGGEWVSSTICVRTTQPPTILINGGPTG